MKKLLLPLMLLLSYPIQAHFDTPNDPCALEYTQFLQIHFAPITMKGDRIYAQADTFVLAVSCDERGINTFVCMNFNADPKIYEEFKKEFLKRSVWIYKRNPRVVFIEYRGVLSTAFHFDYTKFMIIVEKKKLNLPIP